MKHYTGYPMIQTMRWYGPDDPVSLLYIRQSGCSGVVTSLDHIPLGEAWPIDEIKKRKQEVEMAGLTWDVVESIPVHEEIKIRRGNFKQWVRNYQASIRNLASCGIKTITYNFMPVLNWTRTEIDYFIGDGSKALRFQKKALCAFDIYILKRPGARQDYSLDEIQQADLFYASLSDKQINELRDNIIAGLPGYQERFTLDQFQEAIDMYKRISEDQFSSFSSVKSFLMLKATV